MIPRYVDALLEGGLSVNQHRARQARLRRAARARRLPGLRAGRSATRRPRWRSSGRSQHGLCVMALGRSHHLGRIGQWGEQAVSAGSGLDQLRQRDLARHRRALRGRRRALRHQSGLHRHPDSRRAALRARHGDQRGGAGQDPRRAQQGREGVARMADRRPRQSHRRSALRRDRARSARCALSACTRATAWRWCASCSAARSPGGGTWHSDDKSRRRVWNGMLSILIDPARLDADGVFGREDHRVPRLPAQSRRRRRASTRCASPASRSARRARGASAKASRSTPPPGAKSTRPPRSSSLSKEKIQQTRRRPMTPRVHPRLVQGVGTRGALRVRRGGRGAVAFRLFAAHARARHAPDLFRRLAGAAGVHPVRGAALPSSSSRSPSASRAATASRSSRWSSCSAPWCSSWCRC